MGFSLGSRGLGVALSSLALLLAGGAWADSPSLRDGQITIGAARFTVVTPDVIRLEYQPDGRFIDNPSLFAVERSRREAAARSSAVAGGFEIDTARLRLVYQPNGQSFNSSNLKISVDGAGDWVPGAPSTGNLGGTLNALDYFPKPLNPQDPRDLSQGVLSQDGWSLIDDSTSPLLVNDGGPDRWIADRPSGSGVDWYFFGYGNDYAAGLRGLTAIGGAVPLPRKAVFGAWYSRWWKYSSQDYRTIVQEFHDHGFPLDVLVFDMYWHEPGWTGFSWSPTLLPDAPDLLSWLHSQKITVPLNDHPSSSVGPQESMYPEFMRAMGQDPASGNVIPYDAGNRKYLDTLFQYAHSARERDGADFWWLDWYGDQAKHFNQIGWLNEYYYRHSEHGGTERGQSFARWAGWGDHRHPIHFSGDTYADWWMLGFQVPFTATAGNAGAFYWSHDVGGFMPASPLGSFAGSEPPELLARWAQFGALSPVLRLHSTEDFRFDKRPWKWGQAVEDSMRDSFQLRAELLPYLYSTAWQGHRDSLPLVRPLYVGDSSEPESYLNPQEYNLGDALLVAPVTTPGQGPGQVATQAVWFPRGPGRWYHWFTGEVFEPGTHALISSDLRELPLFARGGVPIALQPFSERPSSEPLTQLTVRAYPGESGQIGTAFLYEDDGISKDYESGSRALTPITYQRAGDEVSIEVQPAVGSYRGQVSGRSYLIELPETARATGAWIDGIQVQSEYDEAARVNRVRVPARAISQGLLVTVQASDADPTVAAHAALERRFAGITGETLVHGGSLAEADALAGDGQRLGAYVAREAGSPLGDGSRARAAQALAGVGAVARGTGGGFEVFTGDKRLVEASAKISIGDSNGVSAQGLLDAACGPAQACAFQPGYPNDSTNGSGQAGSDTVRAARIQFQTASSALQHVDLDLGRAISMLRAWSWSGPFAYDPTKPLAGQTQSFEDGPLSPELLAHWQSLTVAADGSADFAALVPRPDGKIAYAATFLHSDSDQGLRLWVQSDDGVEVYLDGIKILSRDVRRSIQEKADEVLTSLPAGDHSLLLKVANVVGGWGFRVGVETGAPISVSPKPDGSPLF